MMGNILATRALKVESIAGHANYIVDCRQEQKCMMKCVGEVFKQTRNFYYDDHIVYGVCYEANMNV